MNKKLSLFFILPVLRLGKTHDHIEIVLKSIHIDDYFLRYIITSCNINQALYLLLDNMLWLNSIGLVDLKKKEVLLNKWSNKFWLFSSILYLARDIHDLIGLVQKEESLKSKKYDSTNRYILNETSGAYTSNLNSNTSSLSTKRLLVQILNVLHLIVRNKRNHPLLLDTLKNIFDIFLPLANLKFVNLTPGMQGLCGLISSLISILVVWDSKYKLTP